MSGIYHGGETSDISQVLDIRRTGSIERARPRIFLVTLLAELRLLSWRGTRFRTQPSPTVRGSRRRKESGLVWGLGFRIGKWTTEDPVGTKPRAWRLMHEIGVKIVIQCRPRTSSSEQSLDICWPVAKDRTRSGAEYQVSGRRCGK